MREKRREREEGRGGKEKCLGGWRSCLGRKPIVKDAETPAGPVLAPGEATKGVLVGE